MVLTTVGKPEDALPHLRKMTTLIEIEPAKSLRQNLWFAASALRDLKVIKSIELGRINTLLKAGANLDAALLFAPPGYRIVKVEEEGARWGALVRGQPGMTGAYGHGPVPAAAVAVAFARVTLSALEGS
jgi:hypothetical protein